MLSRVSLLLLVLVLLPIASSGQDRVPASPSAASLAQGWALLGKGDAAAASAVAWQILADDPHHSGALALAVDADLTLGGSSAGLTAYEKWLGSRRVEAAHVLRRVARMLLVEVSAKQPATKATLEALTALVADGDPGARAKLEEAARSSGFAEARALASVGSEPAIELLIGHLTALPGSKTPIIDALGDSGSKLPVPNLKALLSDPNDLNRAAAADALGRLGASEVIPDLKPLLNDPVFVVKVKAAGALLRLNDSSGLPLLMETAASEHAAIRVAAARELASQPDAVWQNLVRSLTSDPDPVVRLDAARLIAPYDPSLARSILDALARDENIGIREAATEVLVERVASDFATLRGLLRGSDDGTRVRAADRILELTR